LRASTARKSARGVVPTVMERAGFDAFCRTLPHAHHVVQWGGSSVWKVDAKVFAIGSEEDGGALHVTFKTSPGSFDILKSLPGLRPAPYLASRGLKWIQRTGSETLDDDALRDYLRESHRLAAEALPKATRRRLGLLCGPQSQSTTPRRGTRP
jgi:predicted DNA-binding protein (MmcQ/YjbR family)